jgi:hypothetical protein
VFDSRSKRNSNNLSYKRLHRGVRACEFRFVFQGDGHGWVVVVFVVTGTLNVAAFVFSMVMGVCRLRYGAGGRPCPLAKVWRFFGLVPAHQ